MKDKHVTRWYGRFSDKFVRVDPCLNWIVRRKQTKFCSAVKFKHITCCSEHAVPTHEQLHFI